MRLRPLSAALLLLLGLVSAMGLASVLAPPAPGPHDGPLGGREVAEIWLPRHRELIERGRATLPSARVPEHRAPRLRFRRPKRISSDVLPPPPATLIGAQAETQTEPYVAVNPEDPEHMVVGWQETRFVDGAARSLGVAVSTDGGRRWTDALLPGLTVADGGEWPRASDPWPAFGPDGIVYYNSLLATASVPGDNAIAVSVSRDGGFTWESPVEIVRDTLDFNDKNSMVVDAVSDTRHRGNVYVGWDVNVSGGTGFTGQRMVVATSLDEGRSWRRPRTLDLDGTNIGIILRVGADGTVYAIWAGASPGDPSLGIRFAKSTDGGRRFSKAMRIADLLAVGVPSYRTGAILPSFDIDPVSGDLYVVWADARFSGTDQAALIVSRDGGDSWTAPARVSDGPAGAPAMTVGVAANGVGELVVGYYTLRNDPARGTRVDYYVNRSTDGGRSFERGVKVNRRTFDAAFAARSGTLAGTFFLGDYVGLAGTDDGFLAVFTSTRKPSKLGPGRQPDIFGAVTR